MKGFEQERIILNVCFRKGKWKVDLDSQDWRRGLARGSFVDSFIQQICIESLLKMSDTE